MARPSLKEERREQILAAFAVCVARYGVEGATLERIAEEAGLARALIRHNIGNREDLMAALVARFLEESRRETDEMIASLPSRGRLKALIAELFDPLEAGGQADAHATQLCEALIAASTDDAKLAADMRVWMTDFVAAVEGVVRADFPRAGKAKVAAVAAGIVGIYFNTDSLAPLGGMPSFFKASRVAADLLAGTLEAG